MISARAKVGAARGLGGFGMDGFSCGVAGSLVTAAGRAMVRRVDQTGQNHPGHPADGPDPGPSRGIR